MFTLTEEQRKQLLQYMWARPYGEVTQHISDVSITKTTNDKLYYGNNSTSGKEKDDGPKKICPNCQGNGFVKTHKSDNPANDTVMQCTICNSKENYVIKNLMSILIITLNHCSVSSTDLVNIGAKRWRSVSNVRSEVDMAYQDS